MNAVKKYKVFWTIQARADLKEIITYIGQDQPGTGERLYREIRKKCLQLNTQPERYRIVSELSEVGIKHYRQITINPYRIIFKLTETAVYIFAVVDGRRELESFLFDRLLRV